MPDKQQGWTQRIELTFRAEAEKARRCIMGPNILMIWKREGKGGREERSIEESRKTEVGKRRSRMRLVVSSLNTRRARAKSWDLVGPFHPLAPFFSGEKHRRPRCTPELQTLFLFGHSLRAERGACSEFRERHGSTGGDVKRKYILTFISVSYSEYSDQGVSSMIDQVMSIN